MLVKKWIPVDLMGCIVDYGSAQFETKTECEAFISSLGVSCCFFTPEEVDVNTTTISETGEETLSKLKLLFKHEGGSLLHFHLSLMPGYLALNIDERAQFIYECLNPNGDLIKNSRPVDLEI